MPRRTKIVATLGPASSDKKTLARMIEAGLDVVACILARHPKSMANESSRALARAKGRPLGRVW